MMEPLAVRFLIACLATWLIQQTLSAFRIPDPPAWVIMIIVIILAWLYVLFGWYLPLK